MGDIKAEAVRAHTEGRLLEAEQAYRILLERNDDADVAVNYGALLRSQGRLQEGSSHYHRCLKKWPKNRNMLINAYNCWKETGENAASLHWLQHALEDNPDDIELAEALAETMAQAGNKAEAISRFKAIIRTNPTRTKSWMGVGKVYWSLGNLIESASCYQKVLSIDPNESGAKANLLTIYKQTGEFEIAEELINSLAKKEFQNPDILKSIADLSITKGDNVAASHYLAELATKYPNRAAHWLNWAAALKGLKFTIAPVLILKRGLQFAPEDKNLWLALEQALFEMCKFEAAERICALHELDTNINNDEQLFNRQFLSLSYTQSEDLCQKRRDWALKWEERHEKQSLGALWQDLLLEPKEGRRLRVGYISSDFCNHPVGRFLLPVVQNHDCKKIEVWGISCGPNNDWITKHLQNSCEHWLDCRFFNDAQAARLIADLRLDVLVELGGYTSGSRLGILVHRPAPIQLSYLGFPAPTYLSCVDGWLGDEELFGELSPTDQKAHELLKIKGGYMVFDPGGSLPSPIREEGKPFRFGSFNHARKLSESTIDLFCTVMKACPNSELVLKSISFHEKEEQRRIRMLLNATA